MTALYNEHESYPAAWLRNLIAGGYVAPGVVDERSIRDLAPTDVAGAVQFHAFAGIAVWSHALRSAGWPDDRPVWTGSCPCQPFSSAGRRGGFDDDRHLWPVWFELIRECRPDVILGEQVSGPDGLRWFDAVSADLEREGYAVGALDTCAAGVGAPHIRQRLYFVALADAGSERCDRLGVRVRGRGPRQAGAEADRRAAPVSWLGDAVSIAAGRDRGAGARTEAQGEGGGCVDRYLGHDTGAPGRERIGSADTTEQRRHEGADDVRSRQSDAARFGDIGRAWSDAEWIPCSDGKSRPTGAGIRPLVDGPARRVGPDGALEEEAITGQLKGYGNALNAAQAEAFARAVMEIL